MNIRDIDLDRLNSLTKYPSILTYHQLGQKGRLTEEVQIALSGPVIGTEKIDGTNARVILCPDGSMVVGSREDLLWERGDLIGNPAMGIVEALRPLVRRLEPVRELTVLFGEFFGKNVGAQAKNYSREGRTSYRLFDVFRLSSEELAEKLNWTTDRLSHWREHGGQSFLNQAQLEDYAATLGIPTVPVLFRAEGDSIPRDLPGTLEWLLSWGESRATLDASGLGVPEGVVVRSPDRRVITKIRREDYQRTLRRP